MRGDRRHKGDMTPYGFDSTRTNQRCADPAVKAGLPAKKHVRQNNRATASRPKPKPARKAARAKQAPRRAGEPRPQDPRLLKRPGGVTLNKLMSATEWPAPFGSRFFERTGKKKIPIESFTSADGERAYRSSK